MTNYNWFIDFRLPDWMMQWESTWTEYLNNNSLPTEWLMDQPCAWSTLRERECRISWIPNHQTDWLTDSLECSCSNQQFTNLMMQTNREVTWARKRATNLQTQVCSKVDFNSFPLNINCSRLSEPSNSKTVCFSSWIIWDVKIREDKKSSYSALRPGWKEWGVGWGHGHPRRTPKLRPPPPVGFWSSSPLVWNPYKALSF